MKPRMTIDTNTFDDNSIVVDFDLYENRGGELEQTHFGGYVRVSQDDDAQCFTVVVIDADGDVLSQTVVPYKFRPVVE